MWRLLELPNRLRILRCWNCRGVTESDRDAVRSAVRDSNLTLYWEWYPFCRDVDDRQWEEEEDVQ